MPIKPLGIASVAIVLVLGSGVVGGQVPAATIADSNLVANNVYRRLFDDIQLSEGEHTKALAVIRQAFVEKIQLKGEYEKKKPRIIAINARRDSSLKALIKSPADKRKFADRVAAEVPPF